MCASSSGKAHKPVLVILGPTASGKTSLALAAAQQIDAEIISADSRQIYRELTIGSAKPAEAALMSVRHHFINEKTIGEPFTAGDFASQAHERILDIHLRGKDAIVAGGSTLYLEGLLKGFADLPPGDPEIRRELVAELEKYGSEKLYERLVRLDPRQASTLDPTKTRRLMRSLEIIAISGRTVTELQQFRKNPTLTFLTYGLSMPRSQLYERIDRRVDEMIISGLVEEASYLYKKYYSLLKTEKAAALKTVGYQEIFDHFDGLTSFEQAVTLIKQHTRNYAKRQLTFFKNRLNVNWVDAPGDLAATDALAAYCCRTLVEA
ncbi:MAG: tRNA (adenosine(37)-N6)-dimethylallyltransferase MiaA [Chlorobi bacterium]|nr:tRNA (adenosine(37)-N6)-dimethylallyltransferase MiaA [Chlorobiota bacterium]